MFLSLTAGEVKVSFKSSYSNTWIFFEIKKGNCQEMLHKASTLLRSQVSIVKSRMIMREMGPKLSRLLLSILYF